MADTAEHSDSGESELSFSYTWSDEDEEELIRKAVAAEENVIQPYRHEPVTRSSQQNPVGTRTAGSAALGQPDDPNHPRLYLLD